MDSEKCLQIIATEVGIPRDELHDDTEFADLGIDRVLTQAINDRFATASQKIPWVDFTALPDVKSFTQYLDTLGGAVGGPKPLKATGERKSSMRKPPAILLLQGDPAKARKTVFLLPDGSGSAMAYARLPPLGADICIFGLNSPFLGMGSFSTTVEEIAISFLAAIRNARPLGPYIVGGWSAGGFFTTEVVRMMLRAGDVVECVVLIDSPCRLEYEALPFQVVQYLSSRNMMGPSSGKQTSRWLIEHFDGVLAAVAQYRPSKVEGSLPSVFMIDASEGMFKTHAEVARTGLDYTSKVTKALLGPRPNRFEPDGWDALFPNSQLWWTRSSGNHFTMVHPPHSNSLGQLLQDILASGNTVRQSDRWTRWRVED